MPMKPLMQRRVFGLALGAAFIVMTALWLLLFSVLQPTPAVQRPVVLEWSASLNGTADRTITWDKDYRDLTFSENWPLDMQICVPEGCLTIGTIREHARNAR